ncbi:MAG TPA: lipid A deacylase LpxR family protein [Desulfosalsimonadaceae bacterium]|nr:lipid A deacylase LpxR family protein [Desulfosalsimonadaceae bacterium]
MKHSLHTTELKTGLLNCRRFFKHRYIPKLSSWVLIIAILSISAPLPGASRPAACLKKPHHTFSLYLENDAFIGEDDQYTNGIKLTWSRFGLPGLPDDAWLHKWLYPAVRSFGFDAADGSEKAITFSIGQNIFTPDDIKEEQLIKGDRPYAGFTYIELGFHKRRLHHMHTLGLCVGIVGPASYAENLQSALHDIIDSNGVKGWDNQLKNEPVIGIFYDYKKRLLATGLRGRFGSDLIFNTGGTLSNALTAYNLGLLYRWGWNIPVDCGNFPIQPAACFNAEMEKELCLKPKTRFGAHLFLSANGRAVLHNIFLDGNTFRDSHSVDKKPFVGTFMSGIGLNSGRIKTVLACVYQTKEFDMQNDEQIFGSLTFAFRY